MRQFKILNVVGARPNMMKMAPVILAMRRHPDLNPILVHTGQHYDAQMSQIFLEQLGMGEPDFNLRVGSGTHHWQTAEIMNKFGELVRADRPDMIVVAGDVNSTMACALVGAKELIPVAHVEAGLRSFDRTMPEEINRIVTDVVSDLLFTTEPSGNENLKKEGIPEKKVFYVGNAMIDSLIRFLETARQSAIPDQLGIRGSRYALLTLHRPSNVDNREKFAETLAALAEIAREIAIIFPVHPRTAARAQELQLSGMHQWDGKAPISGHGIWAIPPTPYIDFLCLMDSAEVVITDSGGVQEETTYLGVPCLTYRDNTERPVTVTNGTNRLIGSDPRELVRRAHDVLRGERRNTATKPALWDGHSSERIVEVVRSYLSGRAQDPVMFTSKSSR